MATPGRFSATTVETLAKRAALLCSRPSCGVLTSGPTEEPDGAVNIGEAAHIYGITSSSARYDPRRATAELADITNGLWLCRNCHKEVDNDPVRFPAEVLFQWHREHESAVLKRLGHKEDLIRERIQIDRLKHFQDCTYLAQQIVLDRPRYWELKLTMELLRDELGAVLSKWRFLRDGLYVRNSTILAEHQFSDWHGAKIHDVGEIAGAISNLVNTGLPTALGTPGKPGVDIEILNACRLIVGTAQNMLAWEEDVRFTRVPEACREVQTHMVGIAGPIIEELMRIPAELGKIFDTENPTGEHVVNLVFRLPENFAEEHGRILARCEKRLASRRAAGRPFRLW